MINVSTIVIGGLNTDIIAKGATKLLQPGELTYAKELQISPGGKSRNIAQMIAVLSSQKTVAMIGKTSQDPYGLWKEPVESLQHAGVNTDYIVITSFEETKQFPGIALIPVDTEGRNQIYVIPGINNEFFANDIDNAEELFQIVSRNKGTLVLTLELPYETALYAVQKANKLGIQVLFDPGGIDETQNYHELLQKDIFLIKPNEHEAKILTGIEVKDYESAKQAADTLLQQGVKNVLITYGSQGGFFFSKTQSKHIPIPNITIEGTRDETGCGDETMAGIAVALQQGKDVLTSVAVGIVAGTLEFYRTGISPVTKEDLENFL